MRVGAMVKIEDLHNSGSEKKIKWKLECKRTFSTGHHEVTAPVYSLGQMTTT